MRRTYSIVVRGQWASNKALPCPLLYTGMVRISLDIPDDLVQQLAEKGQDLSRAALEALAIDAYRMNRITGLSRSGDRSYSREYGIWRGPFHIADAAS